MQAHSNQTTQYGLGNKAVMLSESLYNQLERIASEKATSVDEQVAHLVSDYVSIHPVDLVLPEQLAGSLHSTKRFSNEELQGAIHDGMEQSYLDSISAS